MIYQPAIVVHGRGNAESAVNKMHDAGVSTALIDPASDSSSQLFGIVTEGDDGDAAREFAAKVQSGNVGIDVLSCPECSSAWVLYPVRPQSSPSAGALDTIVRNVAMVMSGNDGHEFPAMCNTCGNQWHPDAT